MTTTILDTTTWVSYPFTLNEINFVSKVNPDSKIGFKVNLITVEMFNAMNSDAILDLLGDPSQLTHDELVSELIRLNLGASEALIELAGE